MGKREGTANIYKKNSYPHNSLGFIRFLWDPCESTSIDTQRKLWIFTHPSSIVETFRELLSCCGITDDLKNFETFLKGEKTNLGNKNLPSDKFFEHKYFCSKKFKNEKVIIECFHKRINRFRLTGPQSTLMLKKVLRNITVESDGTNKVHWWTKYYDSEKINILNKQKEFFNSSLETLADGYIFAMISGDPRLNPRKVCDNLAHEESAAILSECAPDKVHISPLWIDDIREETKNKISDRDLNKLREKLIVAGK